MVSTSLHLPSPAQQRWPAPAGGVAAFRRLAVLCLLILWSLLATCVEAQQESLSSSSVRLPSSAPVSLTQRPTSTSAALTSTTTSASLVDATATPYTLNNSVSVRSTISISNDTNAPAFFYLPVAQNETELPIHVALSLCSGPDNGVQASLDVNASSSTRRRYLQSAQARLFVSLSNSNTKPGPPESTPDGMQPPSGMAYAHGGFAKLLLNEDGDDQPQGAWIGVWPPEWGWGETGQSFQIQIVASTGTELQRLQNNYGVTLDDTDTNSALLTSFNYTRGNVGNISLVILPTSGTYALPSIYYNSSFCAIADAWTKYRSSQDSPRIASSETLRGSTQLFDQSNVRTQFAVDGLLRATNYTAWLVDVNSTAQGVNSTRNNTAIVSLYPAVKLLTKNTDICRLVYNVDFCPQVAYSIPVGPGIATEEALSVINQTVWPNYANFSRTISTFPCDDPYFGQYSSVRNCADCKRAYQDWLCAVTMPRCTDPVDDPKAQSAAVIDVDSMTGRTSGLNTNLLPYIVNRNATTSRQKYFGDGLQVSETYGEVLPCLYTCLFVQRSCPGPLLSWVCPKWDITAQADYGTFADSGHEGLGAALNGGAGSDLARWGGPLRYIAQDNFGKAYCSALGVDLFLREQNAGTNLHASSALKAWAALVGGILAAVLALY